MPNMFKNIIADVPARAGQSMAGCLKALHKGLAGQCIMARKLIPYEGPNVQQELARSNQGSNMVIGDHQPIAIMQIPTGTFG